MMEYGIDPEARAAKMLAKAETILATVDESFIITQRNHTVRLVPTFRPEEISLGQILGKGGFGIVHEIAKFTLDKEEDHGNDGESKEKSYNASTIVPLQQQEQQQKQQPLQVSPDEMHVHYDIHQARSFMDQHCQRRGVARYALKQLHKDLTPVERARGMIDLAVEAKYLSVVWHPNISKLVAVVFLDHDRSFSMKIIARVE